MWVTVMGVRVSCMLITYGIARELGGLDRREAENGQNGWYAQPHTGDAFQSLYWGGGAWGPAVSLANEPRAHRILSLLAPLGGKATVDSLMRKTTSIASRKPVHGGYFWRDWRSHRRHSAHLKLRHRLTKLPFVTCSAAGWLGKLLIGREGEREDDRQQVRGADPASRPTHNV
ncbi:hypothetical protein LZ30DRAFT_210545 [Colletotrichum cereale]|nr:hypothetical protein LZ30DRAFT_210545 [Colletotrichum cereale]